MLVDICHQPVLVLAHLEEVVGLAELVQGPLAVRTEAAHGVFLGPEALIERAIPAGIARLIDFLFVVEGLQCPLHHGLVPRFRRPHEVVVRNVQALPELLKLRRELVAMRLRRDAPLRSGLLNFLAVFVEAGEEKDVVAFETLVAGQHICRNRRVGMADVRDIVDVVNGSRDVKGLRHAKGLMRLWVGGTVVNEGAVLPAAAPC